MSDLLADVLLVFLVILNLFFLACAIRDKRKQAYAAIAQWKEQIPSKDKAVGSNPTSGA